MKSDARTHRTPKALRAKWLLRWFCFAQALGVRARLRATLTLVFVALTATVSGDDLPRKSKAPREAYPNVDVIYDSVTAPDGHRLRTIITKPRNTKRKLPVIFVAGWLSCDSVEAPSGTKDESGLVFRGLAQVPEFVVFRMDKQGVGDSEGVCSETDFDSELAGYRAAFRANQHDQLAACLEIDLRDARRAAVRLRHHRMEPHVHAGAAAAVVARQRGRRCAYGPPAYSAQAPPSCDTQSRTPATPLVASRNGMKR